MSKPQQRYTQSSESGWAKPSACLIPRSALGRASPDAALPATGRFHTSALGMKATRAPHAESARSIRLKLFTARGSKATRGRNGYPTKATELRLFDAGEYQSASLNSLPRRRPAVGQRSGERVRHVP